MLSDTQELIRQTRLDVLREARIAMLEGEDAFEVIDGMVAEAEITAHSGRYSVGATVGWLEYTGVVSSHTDSFYPNGEGYILDLPDGDQVWVSARSRSVVLVTPTEN